MKLTFHINFHTIWGQQLFVTGSLPELGSFEPAIAREMTHIGDGNWILETEISGTPQDVAYRYFVRGGNQMIFEEWDINHHLRITENTTTYQLYDFWQAPPALKAFYTSAFTQSLFAHPASEESQPATAGKLILKIHAPKVKRGQTVYMTGNQPSLGNWDVAKAFRMDPVSFPEWTAVLPAGEIRYPLEFKCFVRKEGQDIPLYWENGDNRILYLPEQPADEQRSVSGISFRETIEPWKGAGSVIPVFSLRSKDSFGVGDLGDLKKMVDWMEKTGQRIIQILPVNDTTMSYTWHDSYPYSAISIFALHPIYISLSSIGQLKDPDKESYFHQKQIELNALENLDYEEVINNKIAWCREFFSQEEESIVSSVGFKAFIEEQTSWLVPYAAYCYYRDTYKTADFRQWGRHAVYDKTTAYQLCDPDNPAFENILFTFYLQYVLHTQFSEVSTYARKKGVILKGDLPIGIHRNSVEAWEQPVYFNMNGQAGAPPDDFSVQGQNWGFPTYNWDVMEKDNFTWWKNRFNALSQYFDCFRIDHILGFFRIWEIPLDYTQGLCGHFNPALPLTVEEIEESGFRFNESRYTNPHIHRNNLEVLFGSLTGEVMDSYLAQSSSNHFVLKPFCDTQQKITALFEDKKDDYSYLIKKGLLAIANEVLFLRDPYQKNRFHPRISASQSYIYQELDKESQYAYDKLYWQFFYQRHDNFWREKALLRLTPLVNGTQMLVCGEDLGMIPATVPEVMNKLQILSLEIERMPKEINREFTDMFRLPYLSVCTTSTHDMSPIRNWWKEDAGKTQRYYNQMLQHEGKAPDECSPELAQQILSNHLQTRSMLAIIPVQDWFAMDETIRQKNIESERINVPANPQHYWRYRMHIPLETLLEADTFNNKIKQLISESGRA